MSSFYANRTVLVTGGTGSIGSSLVRQLLHDNANVRIVSRDEHKQYMLQMRLGNVPNIEYCLGDVRDEQRMKEVSVGIDTILHCAAYKHVHLCEHNVREAYKTNVDGTCNIIAAARHNDVESVLLISSDKAAEPNNAMGTSKLMAEHHIRNAAEECDTRLSAVRFGNVLGSRGSVIPTFLWQLQHQKPLTVTDPAMTRFFLPLPDATSQLLRIAEHMQSGALYVLKMPAASLGDLVDVCIEELAPLCGVDPATVEKRIIGKREGEKLHERLMTNEEASSAKEHENTYVLPPMSMRWNDNSIPVDRICSDTTTRMTKEELRPLVRGSAVEFLTHRDTVEYAPHSLSLHA